MRTYNLRKRVLVTGGAGFISSQPCEFLLEEGSDWRSSGDRLSRVKY